MTKEIKVSDQTIDILAKDLKSKGLTMDQILVNLANVFPAKDINRWFDNQSKKRGRK